MNVSWMSNPQYLAQVGHFLGGVALIVIAALLSTDAHAGVLPILITLGVGIVVAALKEFWFDIKFEKDSWPDSIMDFCFYMLGGGVGMIIAVFAHRLGS